MAMMRRPIRWRGCVEAGGPIDAGWGCHLKSQTKANLTRRTGVEMLNQNVWWPNEEAIVSQDDRRVNVNIFSWNAVNRAGAAWLDGQIVIVVDQGQTLHVIEGSALPSSSQCFWPLARCEKCGVQYCEKCDGPHTCETTTEEQLPQTSMNYH
jgi:hypothetical protein